MKYTKEQLYNNVYIVDIEATGLLEDNPSIHILSCRFLGSSGWTTMSTTNLDDMRRIFEEPDNIVVGHFFKSYDINVLKLNIPDMKVNCEIIDTLPLSQYLFENMMSHGLEAFGKIYGTLKTEVSKDQWQGLTTEQLEYMWELEALEQRSPTEEVAFQDLFMQYSDHKELMKERCEGDVLINQKLWHDILDYLFELYDGSEEDVNRVINKTNFKMDQLQGQYDNPIKLDLEFTQKSHDTLEEIYTGKKQALEAHMPEVPKYDKKSKPKVMEKKDGTLSSNGKKWYDLLEDLGLQKDEEGPIEYIASYEEPNAGSPNQLKDFLLGLGWQPKEHKDGANGPVPQVMVDEDGVKVLCPNIIKMIPQYPFLENLQGMSVAKHRWGVVKGFLKNDIGDGHVRAQWSGITASWRVKHVAPISNLPSNRSQYGEYIRKCLVAPEGYVWANSDLSSLEDKTKQNCIINLDPEYVETLNVKGFDAHLNLGLLAGFFTDEEVEFFKWYKKLDKDKGELESLPGIEKFPSFKHFTGKQAYEFNEVLAVRRQGAKVSNYSCLPLDTQVLTADGWKYRHELGLGTIILSYDPKTDRIVEDHINDFIDKKGEVIRMSNKWFHFDSTEDHRWFGKQRHTTKKERYYEDKFFTTSEMNSEKSILMTARLAKEKQDENINRASLLGWILSEGSINWSKKEGSSNSKGKKKAVVMTVSQSDGEHWNEIERLLKENGLPYNINKNAAGVNIASVSSPAAREFLDTYYERGDKKDVDWSRYVLDMSTNEVEAFFKSFMLGDGYISNGKLCLGHRTGKVAEAVALAGYLLGYRVSNGDPTEGYMTQINFNENRYCSGQRLKKESLGEQDVFCLNTGNSTFIIKQGDTITITGNCTYGVGAAKLAASADITLKEAKKLINTYWDLNWSVKEFAESLPVKEVRGQKFIWSPYSRLWLVLRSDHMKFSIVNQNFGATVFDVWCYFMEQEGIVNRLGYHDEVSFFVKDTEEDKAWAKEAVQIAINKTNEVFNLPVKFEADVEFAYSYGDVH